MSSGTRLCSSAAWGLPALGWETWLLPAPASAQGPQGEGREGWGVALGCRGRRWQGSLARRVVTNSVLLSCSSKAFSSPLIFSSLTTFIPAHVQRFSAFHHTAVSIETEGGVGIGRRLLSRAPTLFPPRWQPTVPRPPSPTGHVLPGQRSPSTPAVPRGSGVGRCCGTRGPPSPRSAPRSPHPWLNAFGAAAAACSLAPTRSLAPTPLWPPR